MKNILRKFEQYDLPPPMARLVKSLSKKFKLSVSADVEKANELAVYLSETDRVRDSIEFLESYIYDVEYSDASGVWADKVDGLCFLAEHFRKNNIIDRYKNVFEIVESVNFDKKDTDWLIARGQDEFDYLSADEIPATVLSTLTQKDRLLGHFTLVREATKHLEHLIYYHAASQEKLIADFQVLIEKHRMALKKELSV